jgi:ABC-2 type transport system ATP-binding protein
VLVSSHILSEVQQVADTVSIIGRGKLLASGHVSEILAAADSQTVRVGVADPARARAVLEQAGLSVTPVGALLTVGSGEKGQRFDPAFVTEVLAQQRLYVSELTPVRADLESVFLELTADEHLGVNQRGPSAEPPDPPAGGGTPLAPQEGRR